MIDWYVSAPLSTISATIDRTIIIEKMAQRPMVLTPGDPPSLCEIAEPVRAISNGKETGLDGLPAEILTLRLNGEALEILYHFQSIISQV